MTTPRAHLYWIHGVLVESDVSLDSVALDHQGVAPAWCTDGGEGRPLHYRVRLGEHRDCPDSPPAGRLVYQAEDLPGFWVSASIRRGEHWTVRFAGYVDFEVDRPGREVTVRPAPGADLGMISIFLGGTVLAFVLAAEGKLMLHASAVSVEGHALAVAAPAGWGKSTIAAILCGAGAALVTDDALRVDVNDSGVVCYRGTRTIRLRQSAAALGGSVAGALMGETADGRTSLLAPRLAGRDASLTAVVLPYPAHGERRLAVERISGWESMVNLLPLARFGWSFLAHGGSTLFELTADLADGVPVYQATIPWGPPFPPGLAEGLLEAVGLREGASKLPRAT